MKSKTINRRSVVKGAATLASLASLGLRAAPATQRARLVLRPEVTLNQLPNSYNGFSIEARAKNGRAIFELPRASAAVLTFGMGV